MSLKGLIIGDLFKIFPYAVKPFNLGIRTRRWRKKENKSEEVQNDDSFIAEGSKLTTELSDF